MALSKTDLKRVINSVPEPDGDDVGKWVVGVCRAIEAEARKQDDALILQLVEALEESAPHTDRKYRWKPEDWMRQRAEAINAGRARLEGTHEHRTNQS